MPGEAEGAADLLLGVAALVGADEHDLVPAEACQAALDGAVVAEAAVTVQFAELAADEVHVVAEQRPLGVAGDLDGLPGAELLVGLAEQRGVVRAELAELLGVVHLLLHLQRLELVNLLLELGQRPLELQHVPRDGVLAGVGGERLDDQIVGQFRRGDGL
jgi:hypothetical protein